MCPKCKKSNSKIIYDYGYGLSLQCLSCGNYYEVIEKKDEEVD